MLDVMMNDILGTPAILVGLFAFVGFTNPKKSASTVLSGTLKQLWALLFLALEPPC